MSHRTKLWGVNLGAHRKLGLKSFPTEQHEDLKTYREAFGMNAVRWMLFPEDWSKERSTQERRRHWDQNKREIHLLKAEGFFVCISMHQDLFGSAFGGLGFPSSWLYPGTAAPSTFAWWSNYLSAPMQDAFVNLLTSRFVLDRYRECLEEMLAEVGDMVDAIDLFNEPWFPWKHNLSWLEANKMLCDFLRELSQGSSRARPQVERWIQPFSLSNLGLTPSGSFEHSGGQHSRFAPHLYFAQAELGLDAPSQDTIAALLKRFEVQALEANLPLVIGEWGVAGHDQMASEDLAWRSLYLQRVKEELDRRGLSSFVYVGGRGTPYSLLKRDGSVREYVRVLQSSDL